MLVREGVTKKPLKVTVKREKYAECSETEQYVF